MRIDDVVYVESSESVLDLSKFRELLRKGDDVLVIARDTCVAATTTASQIDDRNLHVVKSNEHGFNNAGSCLAYANFFHDSYLVDTEERVHRIQSGELRDATQEIIFRDLLQILVAAGTGASVERRHGCVVVAWFRVPLLDFIGASLQTIQRESRRVLRVESTETSSALVALEKNHVTEDSVSITHTLEEVFAEGGMICRSAQRNSVLRANGNALRKILCERL